MSKTERAPISDHAVLRYCERVKGIDMEWIREEIATPELRMAIKTGAKTYRKDGWVYVLRGGQVVTIYDTKSWQDLKRLSRK